MSRYEFCFYIEWNIEYTLQTQIWYLGYWTIPPLLPEKCHMSITMKHYFYLLLIVIVCSEKICIYNFGYLSNVWTYIFLFLVDNKAWLIKFVSFPNGYMYIYIYKTTSLVKLHVMELYMCQISGQVTQSRT